MSEESSASSDWVDSSEEPEEGEEDRPQLDYHLDEANDSSEPTQF